jgi:hypothetical protein
MDNKQELHEPKTIEKWLNLAIEEGYDWASSALEQIGVDRHQVTPRLSGAVQTFTDWNTTKEKFDYWNTIWLKLKAYGL